MTELSPAAGPAADLTAATATDRCRAAATAAAHCIFGLLNSKHPGKSAQQQPAGRLDEVRRRQRICVCPA